MPVSAARVVRAYLEYVGAVAGPSPADHRGWASSAGKLSEGYDNAVAVRNTGAVSFGREHRTGQRDVHPTVQVTIRATDETVGEAKGEEIEAWLDAVRVGTAAGGVGVPVVTLDGIRYALDYVHVTVPTTYVGEEEKNRRQLFTINAQVGVTQLDATPLTGPWEVVDEVLTLAVLDAAGTVSVWED